MALFAAGLILLAIVLCFIQMRIERRTPQPRYPEAKLTTKIDHTVIKMYLDEHEEKLS